jgi:hypothetical protein
MGSACTRITHGREEECIQVLVVKPGGKRQLGIHRC